MSPTLRTAAALAVATGLLLNAAAARPSLADDDPEEASCEVESGSSGSSNGRSQHGARGKGRLDHDVLVRLAARRRTRRAYIRVRLRLVNQGRERQDDVNVELFADSVTNEPIWSRAVSLRRRGKRRWRLRIRRADVAGELIATATLGAGRADEDPGDNTHGRVFVGASPADDAGRGAALYGDMCSECHGAAGTGGAVVDEDIARESWCEIYDAVREGEDGMPIFPDLSRQDARDIAAFLRSPGTPPTEPPPIDPPPVDPPPGATPTYTANVKPLLDDLCVECHGGFRAASGIRLDSYLNARDNATLAVNAVQLGFMPTSGPLAAAEVTILADWLAGGTLE